MRLRVGIMMLARQLTGPLSNLLVLKIRLGMLSSVKKILNCRPKRLNFMRSSRGRGAEHGLLALWCVFYPLIVHIYRLCLVLYFSPFRTPALNRDIDD